MEAKLRERAREACDGRLGEGYARILAALKETAEEAHAESDAWYSQAMDHLNAMHGRAVKCEQDCWVCAAVFSARAEGERAGREAEREACAKLACNASVIHFAETMGRNDRSDTALRIAAAIRARGSE